MKRWVVLGGLLTACQAAFHYPEARPERGPELCANGVDDDLDGKLDCLDPDCSGACVEASAEVCADGVDQDADGRFDHVDPDCWPDSELEVKQCSSVQGHLRAPLDLLSEEKWLGNGTLRRDGIGPDGAPGTLFCGAPRRGLIALAPTTGAVEGSALELFVKLSEGAVASLVLLPDSARLEVPLEPELQADALFLRLSRRLVLVEDRWEGEPLLEVVRGTQEAARATLRAEELPPDHWARVAVSFREGALRVEVGTEGRALELELGGGRVDPAWPESWGPAEPLRVGFACHARGSAELARVTVERPAWDPCGYRVPQLPGPLAGVAYSPERGLCALTRPDVEVVAAWGLLTHASVDGVAWTELGRIGRAGTSFGAVGLTWDDARGRFVGAVVELGVDGVPRAVQQLSSVDCATWTLDASGLEPDFIGGIADGWLAYDAGVSTADGSHVLWLPVLGHAAVQAVSPRGEPGTFAFVPSAVRVLPIREDSWPHREDRARTIGDTMAVFEGRAAGLMAWVSQDARSWRELPLPLVAPSRRWGAFDHRAVRRGQVVLRTDRSGASDGSGWLFYEGDPLFGCADCGGTAAVQMQWRPRGAAR